MTDRCIIYSVYFFISIPNIFHPCFFSLTLTRVLVLGVAIEAEIPRSSLYPPPQRCSQTTLETKSLQHFLRLPGGSSHLDMAEIPQLPTSQEPV